MTRASTPPSGRHASPDEAVLPDAAAAALLRFVGRFTELTERERRLMLESVTVRRYARNALITDPAELAASGFFVVEGCVCSYTDFASRQSIGDFFVEGEPVLLAPEDPGGGYAQCLRFLEDTLVTVSSADETERLVREVPAFEHVCRRYAEERLGWQMKLGSHLKNLSPSGRWAFLLRERPALVDRVPQHLLASFLGITPETLSRAKADLSR
jgi:hypothetical protein